MKKKTNNSPPAPAPQKPTGRSAMTSEAQSASPSPELIRMVQDRLKYPKGITERECIQIGGALGHLKGRMTALEYHSSLKLMRLTPVAAWDYQAISQNAILRETIVESELDTNPNELAVLANLPDPTLEEMLCTGEDPASGPINFETNVVGQIREDVVIKAGSQFGWPQIAIREGEKWTVTILPTKMGAQGTFFVRVGLHSVAYEGSNKCNICLRTTDTKLGGNPASPCPFCGEVENHEQNVLRGCEYWEPVPYWATYCIVHEITNTAGEVPYFHDPTEPFLFILNEKMIKSVVSASMETAREGFFGTMELTLDDRLQVVCKGTDPQDFEAIQKWSGRLREPAQLCVAAKQFEVYRAAPSIHLY